MNNSEIKLVAMDLDGTITQHKSKLETSNYQTLNKLSEIYRLVIVGAGGCLRIYNQLDKYPIDIIGYYGMQRSEISASSGEFKLVKSVSIENDRTEVINRIQKLREILNLTDYSGEGVEFHDTGIITFPILGTTAAIEEKLKFDPLREKRRKFYPFVKNMFPEYSVFIGGSSSFDIVPPPYNKHFALTEYANLLNIDPKNIVYIGDDYGIGGNDEDVYRSSISFIRIDNYKDFFDKVEPLLQV